MSRFVVLCVESNGRSKTDYMYINATIKRFYKDDKKIVYRPIFLESKSNYNDRSKVKEINKRVKDFPGQANVIYFVDVDDAGISSEMQSAEPSGRRCVSERPLCGAKRPPQIA